MKDAAAALLALLLCCSLPAPVALASASAPAPATGQSTNGAGLVETDGTTNRLGLDGDVRREYASPGPDMGMALAAADAELRVDQESFVVGRGFEDASQTEQRERIEAGLDRIDERIRAMEERERRAVERHANDELSGTMLVQVAVANHNEAEELSDALDELNRRANAIPGYNIDEEFRQENRRLDRYRGPLRSYLDATSHERTGVDSGLVVVETQANGFRLATIRGSTYVHEVARFDNRDATGSDRFDGYIEAEDHTKEELYPWTSQNSDGLIFGAMYPYGLYQFQASHNQGTLEAYLDGGTRAVTYESQELFVDELPTSTADRTWAGDDLTISLNETPGSGPAEVTVVDSQTDEPVGATIAVNGTVVGETNDNGTRWIVPPIGEYELSAESGDASVTATVTRG